MSAKRKTEEVRKEIVDIGGGKHTLVKGGVQ